MSTISERIKEVRQQYGFSQTQFAALGKVSMRAQQTYESSSSNRVPDSKYLINLSRFNIDIYYILTGNIVDITLDKAEQHLIKKYRFADPSKKSAMLAVADSNMNGYRDYVNEKDHSNFSN